MQKDSWHWNPRAQSPTLSRSRAECLSGCFWITKGRAAMDCSHVDNGRGQEDRNAQMSEHGDTSTWSSHGSEGHKWSSQEEEESQESYRENQSSYLGYRKDQVTSGLLEASEKTLKKWVMEVLVSCSNVIKKALLLQFNRRWSRTGLTLPRYPETVQLESHSRTDVLKMRSGESRHKCVCFLWSAEGTHWSFAGHRSSSIRLVGGMGSNGIDKICDQKWWQNVLREDWRSDQKQPTHGDVRRACVLSPTQNKQAWQKQVGEDAWRNLVGPAPEIKWSPHRYTWWSCQGENHQDTTTGGEMEWNQYPEREGTPRRPNPLVDDETIPEDIAENTLDEQGQDDHDREHEKSVSQESATVRMSEIVPATVTEETWRSMYVTRRLIAQHGKTPGCPGCESLGEKEWPKSLNGMQTAATRRNVKNQWWQEQIEWGTEAARCLHSQKDDVGITHSCWRQFQ